MIRPRLLTRNRKPVSASAGCRTIDTGAPLWTPVPDNSISRPIVVWRDPINRLDICDVPRSPYGSGWLGLLADILCPP